MRILTRFTTAYHRSAVAPGQLTRDRRSTAERYKRAPDRQEMRVFCVCVSEQKVKMTRSCRSSSPPGSSKRVQPAAKASQDIPKAACTRKGSFKHSKEGGKSKQFYMWRLRSLLPGVSGQDKVTEVSSAPPAVDHALLALAHATELHHITCTLVLAPSPPSPPPPRQLELVEATIAYIAYLQGMLQQQDGGGDKEVDAPALGEMLELLRGLSVSS